MRGEHRDGVAHASGREPTERDAGRRLLRVVVNCAAPSFVGAGNGLMEGRTRGRAGRTHQ
jgi:hypothetical protein